MIRTRLALWPPMTMFVGNDPFTQPSFTLRHRMGRALWGIVSATLFRPSPRPFHAWRAMLLRLFGAKIGEGVHVYPHAKIWAPWNLRIERFAGVADGAILYDMDLITIGPYAVISQGAHLCGGTHDYNASNFQLVVKPIHVGAYAWICAEAFVHPGVVVPDGAVIGARAVVSKSPPQAWAVYAGHPCVQVGLRKHGSEKAQ
jgi:putative colanic acid biosynthesis acetyltransferase WcaF